MFESQEPVTAGGEESTLKPSLGATVSYVTLAGALRVKVNTLQKWVMSGRVRQPVYYGRLAGWPLEVAKQIVAEGTMPAGTYPPVNSPRAAKLAKRPPSITASLGHQTKTDGQPKKRPKSKKAPPTRKRKKPCPSD